MTFQPFTRFMFVTSYVLDKIRHAWVMMVNLVARHLLTLCALVLIGVYLYMMMLALPDLNAMMSGRK